MNKYQEAYKRISKDDYSSYHGVNNAKKRQKDFDLIKRLVDKATPKKVKKIEAEIRNDTNYTHYCTACGNFVGTVTMDLYIEYDSYCCTCGQKLDWSDEDDE